MNIFLAKTRLSLASRMLIFSFMPAVARIFFVNAPLFLAMCGAALCAIGFFGADRIAFKSPTFFSAALSFLSHTRYAVLLLFVLPSLYFLWVGGTTSFFILFTSCTLSLGWSFAIKALMGRLRPGGFVPVYGRHDSAFPSAHTAGTAASALALLDSLPFLYAAAALCYAAAVAASRLFLQRHFLSDIGGGLLIACLSLPAALYLTSLL